MMRRSVSSWTLAAALALVAGPAWSQVEPPAELRGLALDEGASLRVYDVGEPIQFLPTIGEGQTANLNARVDTIDLSDEDFLIEDHFLANVDGYLVVETPGEYGFRLTSDDGSKLWIDDMLVVNHDGLHGPTSLEGSLRLERGYHPFFLSMFENTVGAVLRLEWRPPGAETFTLVPTAALRTEDQVRVTSPGKKRVNLAEGGPGQPLAGVHPSFDLVTIRPEDFQPKVGGMDFLSDGRLVISTWDPIGGVYILDGVLGEEVDPSKVTITRFAAGLAEPLGLEVVDDEIYVLQKQELTKLVDRDGDGTADQYRAICDDWNVTANFHEFAFGLVEKEGDFYATLAVAINPGGATTVPQIMGRGTCIRIDPETGTFETVAAGLRTPNGIGLGPEGDLFVCDNQGDWLPSSKIVHIEPGRFFNSHLTPDHPLATNPVTPPAVWLPQGEIGNSPSQPILVKDGVFKGQMLHGEVTHGGIKRDFLEKVGGEWQGCVFRFTQGMEAGVNRLAWGPDGGLYVGMIGSTGNWGHKGHRFGLQKLMPNGTPTFEMLAVRATPDGFEIEFTEPLAPGSGGDPSDYHVQQWRYEPTAAYGGPKIDQGVLRVSRATVSQDRTRVKLEIPGLEEGHVVYFVLGENIDAASGREMWSSEAWYTLNRIPERETASAAAAGSN